MPILIEAFEILLNTMFKSSSLLFNTKENDFLPRWILSQNEDNINDFINDIDHGLYDQSII